MHAVHRIAVELVEQPFLDHHPRAAEAFFRRLEDEMNGAGEVRLGCEVPGRAEQHGGMAVMAAAMEAAGYGGAPFQVGVLFHRQRIHVGAQADALSPIALALEHADDAGAAEAPMHLDAPLRKLLGDDA